MPAAWRLIFSPAADGPANMAVDEAILAAVAEGHALPSLRLFAWTPPCLSLGYAQPLADVDMDRLRALGWDVVRRPTGGRAILHTDELTYSVVAPMDEPRVAGGVVDSYRRLSAGLLAGLARLGLRARADQEHARAPAGSPPDPVCFDVPSNYEITVDGKKLLGSAQVRKRGVVLQHGTLPLRGEIARICEALRAPDEASRAELRARVRQRAATLAEALGREIPWQAAAEALAQGFAEALDLELRPGSLSPDEIAGAMKLREEKYAAEAWTARV